MSILLAFGTRRSLLAILLISLCAAGACSVAESKNAAETRAIAANAAAANAAAAAPAVPKGPTIDIEAGGPADTVRAFYKHLREKKFREAMFLTNLRPAIESLTEAELNDFSVDFAALAGQVPADIEINGEIITGDQATVTANLPNEDGDKNEIQTIKLRKEADIWVIEMADEAAAKKIRSEGKNYFYNLRIETHEEEAKKMLERISKAELAYSLQNGGVYADVATLIGGGLLPDDIKTSESTGYNYALDRAADKKKYSANATPATYKKSGVRSFILMLDNKGISRVTGKDNGGKALRP